MSHAGQFIVGHIDMISSLVHHCIMVSCVAGMMSHVDRFCTVQNEWGVILDTTTYLVVPENPFGEGVL